MLKYLIMFMSIVSLGVAAPNFSKIEKVMQVTDLNFVNAEDFFRGKFPDTALECKKGTKLPIKCFLNLSYFSLDYKPNLNITIEKDCYLRFIKNKGYMSYDLVHWEKAKKIVRGALRTQFHVDEETSQIEIKAEYVDTKLPLFEY